MIEKLNKFLYSSIIISILMFVLGMMFIIFPQMSFESITYILSVVLIINGIYFIIKKIVSSFQDF